MKKYIDGLRKLSGDDISFDDEIEFTEDDNGDKILNFYLPVWFDPEEVFDINLSFGDCNYWVNIYANYNVDKRCVVDELDIVVNYDNGNTEGFLYKLNIDEENLFYNAMQLYCMDYFGQTLEEYIESEKLSTPEKVRLNLAL